MTFRLRLAIAAALVVAVSVAVASVVVYVVMRNELLRNVDSGLRAANRTHGGRAPAPGAMGCTTLPARTRS